MFKTILISDIPFTFHFGIAVQIIFMIIDKEQLNINQFLLAADFTIMDVSSYVKLNWDSSQHQIVGNLKQIWEDQNFTDVTLAFDDDVQIKTNKTMLAAVSPVLRGALKSVSGLNACIFLYGLESSLIKSLLDFVCFEEISIQKENLDKFINTATKLKINGFMEPPESNQKHEIIKNTDHQTEHLLKTVDPKQTEQKYEVQTEKSSDIMVYNPTSEIENFDAFKSFQEKIIEENSEMLLSNDIPVDSKSMKNESTKMKPIKDTKSLKIEPSQETIKGRNNSRVTVDEEIQSSGGIRCFLCKEECFQSVEDLDEHDRVAHSRNDRSYKCDQCDAVFYKQLLLKTHVRKEHSAKNSNANNCDICGKSFKTAAKLVTHTDYSHPVPGRMFKCKLCPKESRTKNASNVHYYQAHNEIERKTFEGKM